VQIVTHPVNDLVNVIPSDNFAALSMRVANSGRFCWLPSTLA